MSNEQYIHDDDIGGYSMQFQCKRSNIYYKGKFLLSLFLIVIMNLYFSVVL